MLCICSVWIRNIFAYVVIVLWLITFTVVSSVLPKAAGDKLAFFSLQEFTAAHLVQRHYSTCLFPCLSVSVGVHPPEREIYNVIISV